MTISHYLRQLNLVCIETSRDLRLLPTLLRALAAVPGIVAQLRCADEWRIAALFCVNERLECGATVWRHHPRCSWGSPLTPRPMMLHQFAIFPYGPATEGRPRSCKENRVEGTEYF